MENILFRLFDYQKFEKNNDLQKMIDTVHARYETREMSLEDMEWVNAAGPVDQAPDQAKLPEDR